MNGFALFSPLICICIPLVAALVTFRTMTPEKARLRCLIAQVLTLIITIGQWWVFKSVSSLHSISPDQSQSIMTAFGRFNVDELNAPLMVMAAILPLAITLATRRARQHVFSATTALVSQTILMATFACVDQNLLIVLLCLGVIPPWLELYQQGRPLRVYSIYMGLFVLLLTVGWGLTQSTSAGLPAVGIFMLMAGILLRSGSVPVHSWMPDLFEHASFSTALLFVAPMVDAYAALRLVLPIAPDWAIQSIAIASLITSVYAAGMAIVQKDTRRFFSYLLLSHSSLILVGLETTTPIGLTGALVVWLSDSLALTGFGLTLQAIESRIGRISLTTEHGMAEHAPMLAALFLMTGLASIGFPGAFGFVGVELLVSGAVETYPLTGCVVVIAGGLMGIAILSAFFRIFAGTRPVAHVSLSLRGGEKWAILSLMGLTLVGGLFPQPFVRSRFEAAQEIVDTRRSINNLEGHPMPQIESSHGSETREMSAVTEINESPSAAMTPSLSTRLAQ